MEAQWERPVPFTQGPGQRPELCGKPMVSVNFLLQQLLDLFSFGWWGAPSSWESTHPTGLSYRVLWLPPDAPLFQELW